MSGGVTEPFLDQSYNIVQGLILPPHDASGMQAVVTHWPGQYRRVLLLHSVSYAQFSKLRAG